MLLICITQILSGGSLCGKSFVDDIVEILLCEGGDVEQWRTSKHILVFAFDPLSINSLSFSLLYCALHHIVHIIYMLGFDCVPHLC